MRGDRLAALAAGVVGVRDDQGNVVLLPVGGRALAAQAVGAGQLAVIGGVDDDRILGEPEGVEFVEQRHHVLIGIGDAVEVVVVQAPPPVVFVGNGANQGRPRTAELGMGRRAPRRVEGLAPGCG